MNELDLHSGPYRTTFTGIEKLRESTPQEWEHYGEVLRRVDEAKQWAIGDWLVDGKRHYGDGLYQKASLILDIPANKLEQYATISRRFENLRQRKYSLTYTHHYEVASLKTIRELTDGKLELSNETDYEKIDELLGKAEAKQLTARDLRALVQDHKKRQSEAIRLANEPEKYSLILADPAWKYDFAQSDSRNIDNQYEPSSLDDMKQLRVPAAEDSVLFMWATSPKLPEAIELIEAWGFTYKTCAVWVKDRIGMGYYFRQRHELLLVSGRGAFAVPEPEDRFDSVIEAPRTEHSEKPPVVYDMLEKMYPQANKLELFARGKRDGWESWGDEL